MKYGNTSDDGMMNSILERAPFSVCMINAEGGVDYANPLMLDMTGHSREELTEAGIFDTPPWREAGIEAKLREAFEGKYFSINGVEGAFRSGDKTVSALNVTGVPMQSDGRKKVLLFLENVTESVKAQVGLEKAKTYAELMLRSVPSAVFTVDLDRRVTGWNRAAETITGYTAEDVLGKECVMFSEKPGRHKCGLLSEDIEKPLKGKECVIVCKDGERKLVSKNVDVIRDATGAVVGGIESFEDITEIKRMSSNLDKAAGEWRNTFDAIQDLIFIHKPDGTIMRANKAFADAMGCELKDLPGRKCYELVHGTSVPWPGCPREKTLKDLKEHTLEVNDPKIGVPLLVTTSPMLDDNGELAAIVHIAKNISGIKESEKKLQEKIHDLELFQRVSVGRETRMIELKKENAELKNLISKIEGKNE